MVYGDLNNPLLPTPTHTTHTHTHTHTANQDPIANIMGPAYASIGNKNTLLEIHERLARERARGEDSGSTDELDSSFRLLLLLNSLDVSLLHSTVKQMGK